MPRIFKGIESELRLLLHPCILTGEITDIKVALFTNDPSVAIEFTDRYTIDDNILTLKVPTWAFGTMEDGVINYVIQGMHNDDAFITDRQSNYYLKTPTDYIPEEMPEEVVLGELTTKIVENGVFEYTPSDVDAWNKATIEVNVPDTNGSYDEGYNQGFEDGQNSVECPECPTCNLGEGSILLDTSMAGTYELYASDDGYDGWSKFIVTLEGGGAIKVHKASDLLDTFNNGGTIDYGTYYYVGGKITDIKEINTQYGNATYTLDNGFSVYRGKWMDGNPFGSEDQIKVGAYIVVYGVIADYRGTLQFNAGSQVIAYQECEGGEVVSCNLEDKGVSPSMADRDGNGVIIIEESEGFDGLSRVVLDPTTIYNEGVSAGKAEGGSANLINPIIFSETEGNTINAESVNIPTFVYEGNQYYNVWPLNMAEYEEFKIQIRFQANNGGNEEPVNIFGCEDTDWDNTTFGARIYMGTIFFRMSGEDVSYPYNESAWYDVEMGYNSSKRWIIVNGETLFENDHASFNKPSQNFMIGAINSGGNAFRPFYGKIATIYLEANGNQVWLLPKEEGHMDVYWNSKDHPWVQISGENNARFEREYISGDGMKTITWLGKIEAPTKDEVQGQVDQYTRPAVIFEGVTEVFVEEPHKLQTDDLVEATAWISTKDTVNKKWCLWTKEGKYEGVSVLNGSAFGGDFFEAKCIRLTGITKLFSSTFFPISAEEIHFGNIEYIETSAIESMNELKKIFYTGDGNVTIDNNAIRGANPNGTLYLKNGVDETPWLERLPEGWVVERLNDDGSVNCGGGIEDYAKNEARVLNVTENGVYTSEYTQDGDIVINSNQQITGVYDDGTNFYDTAELFCSYVQLDVIPTEETRIEFWYLPNMPHMGDGFHRVLHSKNEQISFVFGGGGVDNTALNLKFGNKSVNYTPTKSFGTEWLHIIVDRNGATVNDVEMPFDSQSTFSKTEVDLCINGGSDIGLASRLANGTYGMVKIDDTTYIPYEGGFLNTNTNVLQPIIQPNLGILEDGTPIIKATYLNGAVFDTGLKITEDSTIELWINKYSRSERGYYLYSGLFSVRRDDRNWYVNTTSLYGSDSYRNYFEHITISKAGGFVVECEGTKTLSLDSINLSSGNETIKIRTDNPNFAYGLLKINGNIIVPSEDGFTNITTNTPLRRCEEWGGTFEYKNASYRYYSNDITIQREGTLIRSVNVNVVPKIKVANNNLKFAYSSFDAIPEWADFKGVVNMQRMFQSCSILEVRMIDTSSVTDMSNCFYSCSNLKQIATLDTSNVTTMESMCNYCGQLIEFPPLNTIRVTNMREMFRNCNNLVSVPPLDARSVVKQNYGLFGSNPSNNLTDFGGLIGLKASMDGNYGFEKCPNLTYESCINILNGLYDFTGNGVTPTSNEGKLKVHSNFLTTVGDEISIGTAKGWTITA